MSLDLWNRALAMNLTTAFLLTRALVPGMRDTGWGRIIIVSSVTGPVMAARDDLAYAAAKAGMVGLTRALAVDEAAHRITANAVAPGWIATGSQLPSESEQGLRTPVGRSGTAAEVTPIRELDRIEIGNRGDGGSRGPVTEKIQAAFFDIVNGRNAKYASWLSKVPK